MADLLEELKNIRDAELNAKEIIMSANKKADAMVTAAGQKRTEILSKVPGQGAKMREGITGNYKITYTLMLAKLDRDYSRRIKAIGAMDTKAISHSIASAIFMLLKNYGKAATDSKKDE